MNGEKETKESIQAEREETENTELKINCMSGAEEIITKDLEVVCRNVYRKRKDVIEGNRLSQHRFGYLIQPSIDFQVMYKQ